MKAERALVASEESVMLLILIQISNKAELLVEKVPNTRENALQKKLF